MDLRKFLDERLDWQFDKKEATAGVQVTWTRWRRGPVTFYKQVIHTHLEGTSTT